MEKIKWLFVTKLGLLVTTLFLFIVFTILSNWYDWAEYAAMMFIVYPVFMCFGALFYAGYNSIKDRRSK